MEEIVHEYLNNLGSIFHQRSIAIKVLCNLAKSDRDHRLDASIQRILTHTQDEKFITSRQCIQNIWKLAMTSEANRLLVLEHLEKRFRECTMEKHYNLIRQDIIQSMALLSKEINDLSILIKAQELVSNEPIENG